MPKRAFEPETEWFIRGLKPEPKPKLRCSDIHVPLHLQQIHEKTLELLYTGANENIPLNNNRNSEINIKNSIICQNYTNGNVKKPLKQMFIGKNFNLHKNGEIQSQISAVETCTICKIQKSEEGSDCNYCDLLQCSSCAMICSVCALPTCTSCSVNSYGNRDGIFCLTCCR